MTDHSDEFVKNILDFIIRTCLPTILYIFCDLEILIEKMVTLNEIPRNISPVIHIIGVVSRNKKIGMVNNKRCVVSWIAVIFRLADKTIGVLWLKVNRIVLEMVNAVRNTDGAIIGVWDKIICEGYWSLSKCIMNRKMCAFYLLALDKYTFGTVLYSSVMT